MAEEYNIGPEIKPCFEINDNDNNPTKFLCAYCSASNTLKIRETVRCKICGYKILFKARGMKPVMYDAK